MTISSHSPSPDLLLSPDPHSQLLAGQCRWAVSLLLKLHRSLLEQSELSFPCASPPLSLSGGIPIYPVTYSRGKAAPQTPHSSLPLVNGHQILLLIPQIPLPAPAASALLQALPPHVNAKGVLGLQPGPLPRCPPGRFPS